MASSSAINSASSATGMFTSAATGGSELGKEDFLKLLVTQFQYQDPLNPMEDKEFIAQLAQFSALEQQMTMNESMQQMVEVQERQQMISAASYIGREVSARGYGISVADKGKTVTSLEYALGSASASTYVNIFDAAGSLVTSINLGPKAAGQHSFTEWNATDSSGGTVPDGTYTFYLVAKDADGNAIETDTSVTGIVKGVTVYNGSQILTFEDGRMVELANVREVMKQSGSGDNSGSTDGSTGSGDNSGSTDGSSGSDAGGSDADGSDSAGTDGTETA